MTHSDICQLAKTITRNMQLNKPQPYISLLEEAIKVKVEYRTLFPDFNHELESPLLEDYLKQLMKLMPEDDTFVTFANVQGFLHAAGEGGHFDLVKLLIENGYDVCHVNQEGYSPYFYSQVHHGFPLLPKMNLPVAKKYLLETIRKQSEKVCSLLLSAHHGNSIKETLKTHHFMIDQRDSDGRTALYQAIVNKQPL